LLISWKVVTIKTTPKYEWIKIVLRDIIEKENVNESFLILNESLEKWKYLKWGKKEERTTTDWFKYNYSEGGMIFPDNLDNTSRTIITWEWGVSPSRFKHVIESSQWLRRLTPLELERLNMFPDNHTLLDWISDTKRAFFMWNALVTWVVEKIWISLCKKIQNKKQLD
jgi:DNA (cytosine-5)-methyltransferase 1